jgi:small-conductance mechanosensitive channel
MDGVYLVAAVAPDQPVPKEAVTASQTAELLDCNKRLLKLINDGLSTNNRLATLIEDAVCREKSDDRSVRELVSNVQQTQRTVVGTLTSLQSATQALKAKLDENTQSLDSMSLSIGRLAAIIGGLRLQESPARKGGNNKRELRRRVRKGKLKHPRMVRTKAPTPKRK